MGNVFMNRKDGNKLYVFGEIICDVTGKLCEFIETKCEECPTLCEKNIKGGENET